MADWVVMKSQELKSNGEIPDLEKLSLIFHEEIQKSLPQDVLSKIEDNTSAHKLHILKLMRRLQKVTEINLAKLQQQFDRGEEKVALNTPALNQKKINFVNKIETGVFLTGSFGGAIASGAATYVNTGEPLLVIVMSTLFGFLGAGSSSLISAIGIDIYADKYNTKQRAEYLDQKQSQIVAKIMQAEVNRIVQQILQMILEPSQDPVDNQAP